MKNLRFFLSTLSTSVSHPLLFGLYAVAFLYGRNLDQVPWDDAVRVGYVVAAVVIAWQLAGRLLLRDRHRSGLFTSGVVLIAFSYGHIRTAIAGKSIVGFVVGRDAVLLPLSGLLTAGLLWASTRVKDSGKDITKVLNIVAAVMFASAAFPAAIATARSTESSALASGGVAHVSDRFSQSRSATARQRDIYYIVMDRYAGASMRRLFKYDNGLFLHSLEERGFFVARESRTNYPHTFFSLASTLNMNYLRNTLARPQDVYPLLETNQVASLLRSKGYRWVYFPSTHDPTRMREHDDVTYEYNSGSAFSQHFFETTIARAIARHMGVARGLDKRTIRRNYTLFQFKNLPRARKLDGPVFVFAHILLPHEPFVFEADGGVVTEQEERGRSLRQNYVNQLRYANRRLIELVEKLQAGPPDERPIILIQADEGPHWFQESETPEGPRLVERPGNFETATRDELEQRFSILAAYYTPGVDPEGLYPDISPVNSFRAIFDMYFEAKLSLLPDKHYGWKPAPDNPDGYEFIELSGQLGLTDKPRT